MSWILIVFHHWPSPWYRLADSPPFSPSWVLYPGIDFIFAIIVPWIQICLEPVHYQEYYTCNTHVCTLQKWKKSIRVFYMERTQTRISVLTVDAVIRQRHYSSAKNVWYVACPLSTVTAGLGWGHDESLDQFTYARTSHSYLLDEIIQGVLHCRWEPSRPSLLPSRGCHLEIVGFMCSALGFVFSVQDLHFTNSWCIYLVVLFLGRFSYLVSRLSYLVSCSIACLDNTNDSRIPSSAKLA